MSKLAINGGTPVRTTLFPSQHTLGIEEEIAVNQVLNSHILTGYQGNFSKAFFGGPRVQELEKAWSTYFKTPNAMAINSCTSGLIVACGAIGLKPGDEVIVTPFSMTCSATAPMVYGAKPVFVDIERDYYCIDIDKVEEKITEKTKAIIIVDIFGQPHAARELIELARRYDLFIIEDAAQAIWSDYGERKTGTLGDIGVFSLNQGKHITAGEGGMIVCDDDGLMHKCRLLMNHAEAVNNDKVVTYSAQIPEAQRRMFGWNLRMTEIQAAIALQQLHKLPTLVAERLANVSFLGTLLNVVPCLTMPKVRPDCTHTFYVLPVKYNPALTRGVHRDAFVAAVKAELTPVKDREAEGVPIGCGYITPINNMPLFQGTDQNYELPEVCRQYYEELIILHRFIGPNTTPLDLDDIATAFLKVYDNIDELPKEINV